MTQAARRSAALVVPYVVWMALMSVLPATAVAYAARSAATAAALVVAYALCLRNEARRRVSAAALAVGVAAGLFVLAVWIAPETWFGLGGPAPATSPYAPAECGWPLAVVRLCGSAFVISVAEELFFRKWLVEFAGFPWMVVLFAVEHGDRWAVGAVAGVVYGLLARRFGIVSSIVAHVVTNFALGAWVLWRGAWQFW